MSLQRRDLVLSAAAFTLALMLSYWLVFTLSFFEDVLPHGGVW